MADGQKVTVTVTPEMAAEIREVVEAGEYASAGEVVHAALRDWSVRRTQQHGLEELGRLWDEGMASGPAVDGQEAFARIRKKLDAKLAARGRQ
jgi:antitoxin ParD1/3/4